MKKFVPLFFILTVISMGLPPKMAPVRARMKLNYSNDSFYRSVDSFCKNDSMVFRDPAAVGRYKLLMYEMTFLNSKLGIRVAVQKNNKLPKEYIIKLIKNYSGIFIVSFSNFYFLEIGTRDTLMSRWMFSYRIMGGM